jgi:hypothetical protein
MNVPPNGVTVGKNGSPSDVTIREMARATAGS